MIEGNTCTVLAGPQGLEIPMVLQWTPRGWYWFGPEGDNTGVGGKTEVSARLAAEDEWGGVEAGAVDDRGRVVGFRLKRP